MNRMVVVLLSLACAVSICACVLAYPADYGPFEANEKPKPFVLHKCDLLERQDSDTGAGFPILTYGIRKSNSNVPQVRLTPSDKPFGMLLTVLDSKEQVIAGLLQVSNRQKVGQAYYADLNADKRQDFVVKVVSNGCGLAGGACDFAFALSAKKGYEIWVVATLFPDPEDFVDLRGDSKCQVIQTSLIRGEAGKDGKTHNYWVYTLIEIEGAELKISSRADPRFPKWIWFTFKPNHKATTQLAEAQKNRLWKAHADKLLYKYRTKVVHKNTPQAGCPAD